MTVHDRAIQKRINDKITTGCPNGFKNDTFPYLTARCNHFVSLLKCEYNLVILFTNTWVSLKNLTRAVSIMSMVNIYGSFFCFQLLNQT